VDGLVDRLLWLVEHRDAWRLLAEAGRRRIEQQFDCSTQGRRLADIYRQLSDAPGVAPATVSHPVAIGA
jgi:glycosyltransferase involved in cell wall biosynthesis